MIRTLRSLLNSHGLLCSFLTFATGYAGFAQPPHPAPLALNKPVERELKGGERHIYEIILDANQLVSVVVEQKGVDVVVSLFGPGDKKLAEVDSLNGTQGPEPISSVAETAGRYRLEIRSLEAAAPAGRYEVKLTQVRAATELDKKRETARRIYAEAEALQNQRTAPAFRAAIGKYRDAVPLYRAVGDKRGEAIALAALGAIHSGLGEFQESLRYFNESLEITRAIGDKFGTVANLTNIGSSYDNLGEKQLALSYFTQTLPIFREMGDKGNEALTLSNIGLVWYALGEQQQALKFYSDALPLARAAGNKYGEAIILSNIGAAYAALADMRTSLKFLNDSLAIRRAIGDKQGEAVTLNNVARANEELGAKQEALKSYNEALVLFRAVGDKASEAVTLNNIGAAHRDIGDTAAALKYYDESLALARVTGDKGSEGVTLNNMAAIYRDTGERQRALGLYAQSLPFTRGVGDKRSEADTLYNLSFAKASNNPRFSIFYGKMAVNNLQVLRSNVKGLDRNLQKTFLKSIEKYYRLLADTLIKQQRLAEAQQILNFFKDQQFFDFGESKTFAPVAVTAREAALMTAFNQKLDRVVVSTRSLDSLRRRIGRAALTENQSVELKTLEEDRAAATDDYLAFLASAEKEFASATDGKDAAPTLPDLSDTQKALAAVSAYTGRPAAAIYTLVAPKNYQALVITPTSAFSVETPIKAAELNNKAVELWTLLRSPDFDPRPAAHDLYKVVFARVAAKLPKNTKTILWSLDGTLRYIPMGALNDGRGYLAERYESVVFTRADSERITRATSALRAGSGFGVSEARTVELGGESIEAAPLPAVRTEMRRIFRSAVSPGVLSGDLLLDEQFTRPAMLSTLRTGRPLVHIASHFMFQPGDEARSFLLLGDGTPFTLDQMKNEKDLFKGVDLLTLSACQTAAQRPDANGREVDGFAELAQRLGAGAVMASLWEVSDSSTAELMARFYRNYVQGGMNKAQAIRNAQLALLKGGYRIDNETERQLTQTPKSAESGRIDKSKLRAFKPSRNAPYAHPYYWSPFILIGNWK